MIIKPRLCRFKLNNSLLSGLKTNISETPLFSVIFGDSL